MDTVIRLTPTRSAIDCNVTLPMARPSIPDARDTGGPGAVGIMPSGRCRSYVDAVRSGGRAQCRVRAVRARVRMAPDATIPAASGTTGASGRALVATWRGGADGENAGDRVEAGHEVLLWVVWNDAVPVQYRRIALPVK